MGRTQIQRGTDSHNHPLKKHKVGEAQKNFFSFLVFLNEQSNKEERERTFSNAFASWPAAMRLATSFLSILTKACFRFRIGPILAFMHFTACLLINPPKNHQSTPTRTTKNQEPVTICWRISRPTTHRTSLLPLPMPPSALFRNSVLMGREKGINGSNCERHRRRGTRRALKSTRERTIHTRKRGECGRSGGELWMRRQRERSSKQIRLLNVYIE